MGGELILTEWAYPSPATGRDSGARIPPRRRRGTLTVRRDAEGAAEDEDALPGWWSIRYLGEGRVSEAAVWPSSWERRRERPRLARLVAEV